MHAWLLKEQNVENNQQSQNHNMVKIFGKIPRTIKKKIWVLINFCKKLLFFQRTLTENS